MERLDVATHSKKIQEYYDKVVLSKDNVTYAVFTSEKATLVPSTLGDGDISDFLEEFEEGKVQYGLARVNPPGSDVYKLVLLGWCPDTAPFKSRSSFGANFGEVAKIMRGYHVQITARDSDDLDVKDILKTVSDAAGARYSIQYTSGKSSSPKAKPQSFRKPEEASSVLKPKIAHSIPKKAPVVPSKNASPSSTKDEDEDDWNGEKEVEVRDFTEKPLEKPVSSYKPHPKVDLDAIRKEGNIKAPLLVKEPVSVVKPKAAPFKPAPPVKTPVFGTKAPIISGLPKKSDNVVGGLSRNFGAENGKTPAQLWAEKKGKFKKDDSPQEDVTTQLEASSLEDGRDEELKREEESEPEFEHEHEHEKEEEPEPEPVQEPEPEPEQESEPEPESEQEPEPESEPELEQETEVESKKSPSPTQATALYDYTAEEDNEISITEGELIVEIEKVDEEWWIGVNSKGEKGLFVASYVKEVSVVPSAKKPVPPPPAPRSQSPKRKIVVAEYDYDAAEDNELTFKEGDKIEVLDQPDDDWWLGQVGGQKGLFPSNYVSA
ncbi:BA75_02214T0 [Komagataella pastoris]|uniref:BA75_02214T0 n=1 Tax=Komagataella pastoris TaxID=4922 RepID=A0A1B2JAX5_PICPA|nr:BA75_02214T0 [Komagataella pastoris]